MSASKPASKKASSKGDDKGFGDNGSQEEDDNSKGDYSAGDEEEYQETDEIVDTSAAGLTKRCKVCSKVYNIRGIKQHESACARKTGVTLPPRSPTQREKRAAKERENGDDESADDVDNGEQPLEHRVVQKKRKKSSAQTIESDDDDADADDDGSKKRKQAPTRTSLTTQEAYERVVARKKQKQHELQLICTEMAGFAEAFDREATTKQAEAETARDCAAEVRRELGIAQCEKWNTSFGLKLAEHRQPAPPRQSSVPLSSQPPPPPPQRPPVAVANSNQQQTVGSLETYLPGR
jgi:hypothetical protein